VSDEELEAGWLPLSEYELAVEVAGATYNPSAKPALRVFCKDHHEVTVVCTRSLAPGCCSLLTQ
jgi:hypothetical protein